MAYMPLLDDEIDSGSPKKRGGPPNRMNDLPYRDWMKFQKSFFRHRSDQFILEECIRFFTKAVWPDGQPSRTLVCGFESFDPRAVAAPRIIRHVPGGKTLDGLVDAIAGQEGLDFLMVDLRLLVASEDQLASFITQHADRLFAVMRKALKPDRYCAVTVSTGQNGGSGFPIPWAVAQASRSHLRLRDEKVGLVEQEGIVYYCLFMQAKDDERRSAPFDAQTFRHRKPSQAIPGWVIPKPPPRKKNEVLHPAKYPETLVEGFIELFTRPGDTVLDPMVGTGSTVVAALRKGRNGVGIDLSAEFAEIARRRVESERQNGASLFEKSGARVLGRIVVGDATRLDHLPEIVDMKCQYAVTSPPYWSMLTNPGSENQEARRKKDLPLVYSKDDADLGNIQDYDRFLALLDDVYTAVAASLISGGILTVVVKNVKRNHVLYPLAWDLAARLCRKNGKYEYIGTTLWCQDDVGLKPFAVGIHWVSNILHHYCLHFRKRKP